MTRGPLRHRRILASAGSGKTFQLSSRYIELVRRGAEPSSILASTFTRAAAAEIRDRILGRLAQAVLDVDARAELDSRDPPAEAEAVRLLERVVERVDRLQVRTLDSLFASIVVAFAVEFGLPPEPSVLDGVDEERVREDALERMVRTDDAPTLLATLAALAKGHPGLRVADAILDVVAESLNIRVESEPSAWEWADRPVASDPMVQAWIAALAGLARPTEGRVASALDKDVQVLQAIDPQSSEAWLDVASKGLFKAILENGGQYYRKALPNELLDAYAPLIEHARSVVRRETIRRTVATRDVAGRFLAAFDAAKVDVGAVTFADLTRAIVRAADSGEAPALAEVFFRIDAAIRHALLDEFQDTSVTQWRALLPIVREIVAGDPDERSLFVVGDLKQSIYGWRGASPALLEHLPGLVFEGAAPGEDVPFEECQLAQSWRTAQLLLDRVNDLFGSLGTNQAIPADTPILAEAATAWAKHWVPHEAAKKMAGVVEVHAAEPAGRVNSVEQQKATLELAANLVAELRRDHPAISIGVLCRRNAAVANMLNLLHARGVAASARGVGSLQDAASVNAILDALLFADHPDHTIASFHVARSPLGPLVGLGPESHRKDAAASRRRVAAEIRHSIDRLGYAELVRRWRDDLVGHVDDREARRLDELVTALVAFDGPDARAPRPAEVVRAMRALDLDETGGSGTVVMNIHQSKGLEFDAVVVCDADGAFRNRRTLAATRSRPDGPYARVVRWPPKALLDEEFRPTVEEATQAEYREFLSTLYVALTRARRGLFVVGGPPSRKEGGEFPNSFTGIVRAAWCPQATGHGLVFVDGDRSALSPAEPERHAADGDADAPGGPVVLAPPRGRRATRASSASQKEQRAERSVEASGQRRLARVRGMAIHAMLETVGWSSEPLPTVDALAAAGRRAAPRADTEWLRGQANWLLERLGQPAIGAVLRRPSGQATLLREWRFARSAADGIEEGTVDRLVVCGPPNRPDAAVIVDFKSDRGDAVSIAETYRPQIAAYRAAVAERFGLRPESVRGWLVFLEAAAVIEA